MTLAREGSPNIPIAQQTGCLPHALGALQIVSLSGRTVVGGLGGSPCFPVHLLCFPGHLTALSGLWFPLTCFQGTPSLRLMVESPRLAQALTCSRHHWLLAGEGEESQPSRPVR